MAASLARDQETATADRLATALVRKTARVLTRRARTEEHLRSILPSTLEMGTSVHVLSHGDVDALSYLIHIAAQTPLESVLLSTWCMAMPDIEWLREQIETGRIGHLDLIAGEIFPSQYPDEYLAVLDLQTRQLATVKIARNHAKIIAGISPDASLAFVVETSANVNTNPRIEQAAIHMSRELYDHVTDFYSQIKSIDRATRTAANALHP